MWSQSRVSVHVLNVLYDALLKCSMGWCPSCSVTKQCVSLISCSTVSAWPRVTASQSQRLQMSLSDSWRHSVGIPTRLSGTFCQEPHWCCTHWSRPGFMCHAVLPAVCGRVALLLRPPTPPWTGQSVAASLSQSVSGKLCPLWCRRLLQLLSPGHVAMRWPGNRD